MTPGDVAFFLLILLVTALGYIGFVWAIRSFTRWMMFPGPKPDPTDELGVAMHDLQLALGQAILPPIERLARWLTRHLPKT